jgi:phosphate/sulfate permease
MEHGQSCPPSALKLTVVEQILRAWFLTLPMSAVIAFVAMRLIQVAGVAT